MGIYVGENPLSVPGMSAYQEAIKGGFAGTREDFDKALKDLPGHLADEVRHITAEERASWNNKAPEIHASQHAANGSDPINPTDIAAVAYNTAQSLTDAQKMQARNNMGLPSASYGYGNTMIRIGHDNITDDEFIEAVESRLSAMNYETAAEVIWVDHPTVDGTTRVGTLWKSGYGRYAILTGVGYYHGSLIRRKNAGVWGPFEWSDPPMNLGTEYRTVERYYGSPVYVKIVDCGNIADNKTVAHGISNMNLCISYTGIRAGVPMPQIYNHSLSDTWTGYVVAVDRTNITLACGSSAAGTNCQVILKYTKTTDP